MDDDVTKANDDDLDSMTMNLKDPMSSSTHGTTSGLLQSPAADDAEALYMALHMSQRDDNQERSNLTPTAGKGGVICAFVYLRVHREAAQRKAAEDLLQQGMEQSIAEARATAHMYATNTLIDAETLDEAVKSSEAEWLQEQESSRIVQAHTVLYGHADVVAAGDVMDPYRPPISMSRPLSYLDEPHGAPPTYRPPLSMSRPPSYQDS